MRSPPYTNPSIVLAILWSVVVFSICWHQWQFWSNPNLDTDIFALLPSDPSEPAVEGATRKIAAQGDKRIVVMLGGKNWSVVEAAARQFERSIEGSGSGLHRVNENAIATETMKFYRSHRDALLTPQQQKELINPNYDDLARTAISRIHGLSFGQPTSWLEDPLGLWTEWWSERLGLTAARPRDGLLWLEDHRDKTQWAVLLYETEGPAFRLDGDRRWGDAIDKAFEATSGGSPKIADKAEGLKTLAAGIPLHAESGAVQGNREMNTIGWGSLIAVLLLVWMSFRAASPILLIAISLLVGVGAAISATVLMFGKIHLITLVFGSSLVGVAEDFGIHYFSSRLESPHSDRWVLMKHLLPGLCLALITSVVGYLVLGIVPFPGLRQMALFSSVGLLAAFLTAVCWFPALDRGKIHRGRLATLIIESLDYWPRLQGIKLWLVLVAFTVACIPGLLRLSATDDLRQFQSSPPSLLQAQMEVGRLLKMPSPAQFFLIHGKTPQEVLEREELLKGILIRYSENQTSETSLSFSLVSDWLPSDRMQLRSRRVSNEAESKVIKLVSEQLSEELERPNFNSEPLDLENWIRSPASVVARAQWLGRVGDDYVSVVLIRGLSNREQVNELRELGSKVAGVSWVDRPYEIGNLLRQYRHMLGWLLVGGHLLVLTTLATRFRRTAWRAWIPTALGSLASLAVLGYTGEPFQLFSLFALILLLAMGIDYGIFLLEHRGNKQGYAWLAVLVGAISTSLSFGLLALSATPALHSFGLTLLIGLTVVCLTAPLFRLK